jgi:hypothetical protein
MGKKASIIQILIFTVFIGAMFVLNIVLPDKEFSEVENKYLAQMPKFTAHDFFFGDFTSDYEKYCSDQFVMRDKWITVKAATELAAGKGENNDVYYCDNGTLITNFTAPSDEDLEKKAGYINAFAENVGIPVYTGIIPGAAEIWRELLPENAPSDSQAEFIEKLYSHLNTNTIDFMSALEAHKDEYIFYRTDHHWTTRGAYYGYTAVMDAMGLEAQPITHYGVEVVTDDFLGTSYSSSGFTWVEPDDIRTFVQPYPELKILNYSKGQPVETELYDTSYLEKKDKYSMFFGGISPLLEIETGNEGLPSLLIVRDSYMDSLSPFLFEHFSNIHIMDLRYYNGSISQYAKENNIDSAMICYSASNFSTDTNLYKLAK